MTMTLFANNEGTYLQSESFFNPCNARSPFKVFQNTTHEGFPAAPSFPAPALGFWMTLPSLAQGAGGRKLIFPSSCPSLHLDLNSWTWSKLTEKRSPSGQLHEGKTVGVSRFTQPYFQHPQTICHICLPGYLQLT